MRATRATPFSYLRSSASIGGFIHLCCLYALCGWFLVLPAIATASDRDEFKVKREEVFEFARRPQVTRQGDRVTISFESKALCDASVAIEDQDGRIIRHLASGVLGPNAPEPFQRNARRQTLVWDGKDDQGSYVDGKDRLTVRVSLGLKPTFEKKVFGDPKRRIGFTPPLMAAAPEGVYVFDARGTDFLRLFDHEGNYARTLYPFDADRLEQIVGLAWHQPPRGDQRVPFKFGFTLASMLTSGTSCIFDGIGDIKHGRGVAATAMALANGRIALAYLDLNRLATDGTTGGLPLKGGRTGYRVDIGSSYGRARDEPVGPTSAALSPDGKTLYLTGYIWRHGGMGWVGGCLNGVIALDYETGAGPRVFAGQMTPEGFGSGPNRLAVPTSVACDANGRVYVADHWNDRLQVFAPDGTLLKSIPVDRPTKVMINPKNGDIWVASYLCYGVPPALARQRIKSIEASKPTLTHLGPFDRPDRIASMVIPVEPGDAWSMLEKGQALNTELDFATDPPTLWVAGRKLSVTVEWVRNWQSGAFQGGAPDPWRTGGIQLLALKDGAWTLKRSFAEDTVRSCLRATPPDHSSQRLYVNPKTGRLYVFEQRHPAKSFEYLVEIDPESDAKRLAAVPFSAEDLCFDLDGLAYLRTDTMVVRYDPTTWSEVPWDYGEARRGVGFSGKSAAVTSGLPTPGVRPVCWNMGGMWVSPRGHLAVACSTKEIERARDASGDWKGRQEIVGKPWRPQVYPGIALWDQVHVWDRHGRMIYEDCVPGCWRLDGVAIDEHDNLYVMADATRVLDGTTYPNEMVGTLVKVRPRQARMVSSSSSVLPLPQEGRPARDADLRTAKTGPAWVAPAAAEEVGRRGAEWFYGGVGYGGFNSAHSGGGCACWHARFTLDLYARSFAPESEHFSVAVLDSAGNLILRVGRYGNEDSAGPTSRVPLGGDEVGLMYPMYLATHTDKRLFIADAGNARIVSVKLGYHAEEKVALKDVPEGAK